MAIELVDTKNWFDSPDPISHAHAQGVREGQRAGNALYATIVRRLEPYFPPDTRDLEWDVLPSTLEGLAKKARGQP